jgi:hypothetical protein
MNMVRQHVVRIAAFPARAGVVLCAQFIARIEAMTAGDDQISNATPMPQVSAHAPEGAEVLADRAG